MGAIRKILVPTDFSAHADEALRVALGLARMIGAEVILFHIAQPPAVVSESGRFLANPGKGDALNLWDRYQSVLANDRHVRVEHEVIVAERPSAAHILEMLDNLGCDLIVMGTHGRYWLRLRSLGSLAEEVVRHAPCPVMVVNAPVHKAAPEVVHASGSRGSALTQMVHAG
jgi:nucleotide-binding universal stress UspA family protein